MRRQTTKALPNGRASPAARISLGSASEAKGKRSAKAAAGKEPKSEKQEASVLARAAAYCLRHFPTLWTIGKIRREKQGGKEQWRIAVVLRYPTGYEKELGELVYDGKDFALATPRSLMNERARRIADDPALQQEWDDYRGSSFPARKA